MSNRVMEILRDYSPNVETYSIDESFLSLNGLSNLWPASHRVRQWTGLPVCVGIGPSKTLAKLANHNAKKNPQFNGVCDLVSMPQVQMDSLLAGIGIVEVWGVGRRIGLQLHAAGIKTVKALRDAPPSWLRAKFGVVMERTGNELRGLSCLALEEIAASKKQIISSRSFGQLIHTLSELNESVASHASSAAEKLRRQNAVCGAIQVFVKTNPFREQDSQYSNSIMVPLPNESSDTLIVALRRSRCFNS